LAKINPVKLKQDADKLEKANKLDQAIALYKQVIEDNPRDWNIVKKIGDLYVRLNKMREAMVEYQKVADFYARDGFHLKAIAIWKQINKLDATALEPYANLAELYGKQGLLMEAKSQYQFVVDEYLKRGKNRDAGEILKKMAEIDPADLKVRSKLADLYTRDGNSAKAVDEHIAIAEELNKKGHLAEALQVLEKGVKIDPSSARMKSELARVHLVQKNYDKAAAYLEDAVKQAPKDTALLSRLGEAYLGSKKIGDAEAIFKRLLEIDPNVEDVRVQMGRVHLLRDEYDRAHDEFLPVVEKLVARKDADKAAALLQQIVQKNPSHVKSLARLAEIYKQFQKDGQMANVYSQLTEAYINAGRYADAAGTLEDLVAREPQNAQYRSKLEFVRGKLAAPAASGAPAPVADEDEFDLTLDADAGPAAAPPAAARPAPAAAPAGARPAPAPAAAPAPPARQAIAISGPLSEEEKEFIDEHLAEGKVFRKYGLVDKAADQFEAVVARFPDNVEARQELREVYREKGQGARAAAQCVALAEVFRLKGDEVAAAAQEAEALKLDPASVAKAAPAPARPAAARPAPAAPAAPPPRPAAPPPPAIAEQEDEEEIHLGVDDDEVPILDTDEPAALESSGGLGLDLDGGDAGADELNAQFIDDEPPAPPAHARPAPSVDLEEDLVLEEDLGSALPGLEEAVEEEIRSTASAPAVDDLALEEDIDFEAEEPAHPPAVAPLAARHVESAPAVSDAPDELAQILGEVDSYISLGFVDDAKEALREARRSFPDHPAIEAKLAELGMDLAEPEEEAVAPAPAASDPFESLDLGGGDEAPAEAPETAAEPMADGSLSDDLGLGLDLPGPEVAPTESEGLDLGDELNELFGTQAAVGEAPVAAATDLGDSGLADIFKEFKKGVDKQLGKEDYDTRYNLGIAYKEMGLLDEAIAEFQLAAKDEGRMLECSSMLGICFMEKGMPKLAVKWFDRGLKAPGRTEEEYAALRYDLAVAHEAAGEAEVALTLFTDLYGQDANFRDVAAKVRELRAARG
jgi:tetratricopeptide (TPR) repeat protein